MQDKQCRLKRKSVSDGILPIRSVADFSDFFFMFQYGAVKFVCQGVDGGIHVLTVGLDVQVFTGKVYVCLGLMAGFFYRQRYSYRNDVRSVAVDALQFLGNVVFDGFGDIDDTAPSVGSVRRDGTEKRVVALC